MISEAPANRMIKTFTQKIIPVPDDLRNMNDLLCKDDECVMRILSQEDGDRRLVWNKFSIPEISAARKMFDDLVREGMVPYRVGVDGDASSVKMTQFDPSVEEIIFMPIKALIGG